MCDKYLFQASVVGPGIKAGMNIKYEDPREVGADRIANALLHIISMAGDNYSGFWNCYYFDAVSAKFEYLGGHCTGLEFLRKLYLKVPGSIEWILPAVIE